MKYCVSYYKNFRYNDIIDEVVFNYATYRDSIVDRLQEQGWKDEQRIIIDICLGGDIEIIPILKMCMKNHNNFAVRLDVIQEDLIPELKKAEIPFFFTNYANTPDEIYGMIQKGVSDVYVTESLGFNIANIGAYCKKKDINVRIIPNIAQYRRHFRENIPDPCKFFVRPEDTDLYEPYVDVFEIISSNDRLSILFEIYKNRQWLGDLKKLIIGLKEPFYNSSLVPYFGTERLKCNQKCMQEKCNLCPQMQILSHSFMKNNLAIMREKKKEWQYETKSYKEALQLVEETAPNDDAQAPEE